MKYAFQRKAGELFELPHIQWVVNHIGDYEFVGAEAQAIRDRLCDRINKRTVYYNNLLDDYRTFCDLLLRNPYIVKYDLNYRNTYIVPKKNDAYLLDFEGSFADEEQKDFQAPMGFGKESKKNCDKKWQDLLDDSKREFVWNVKGRVMDKCDRYLSGENLTYFNRIGERGIWAKSQLYVGMCWMIILMSLAGYVIRKHSAAKYLFLLSASPLSVIKEYLFTGAYVFQGEVYTLTSTANGGDDRIIVIISLLLLLLIITFEIAAIISYIRTIKVEYRCKRARTEHECFLNDRDAIQNIIEFVKTDNRYDFKEVFSQKERVQRMLDYMQTVEKVKVDTFNKGSMLKLLQKGVFLLTIALFAYSWVVLR